MNSKLIIEGGRVIDPAEQLDAVMDVCVADGRITAVGVRPDGFEADAVIDARGRVVCPGLVDLCARLREPGQEHKGNIAGETRAAAAGGVTTLFCPPDTDPIIDTPAVVNLIRERSDHAGYCRVHPIGALTKGLNGQDLSEMRALRAAGCLAVSNAWVPVANPLVLRRALEYAANSNLVVIIRPNDPWLSAGGCAHEGAVATRLGLPGIPVSAETVAIAQTLALVEEVRGPVHFAQLSTARSVDMVAEAQARGLPVSADVAVHHLHFSEDALEGFQACAHVIPPFRAQADREALRAAVASGVVGAICSDHQPHDLDAKLDAFPSTEPGIAALEWLLPLSLRWGDELGLPLLTTLARLTAGPARALESTAGTLRVGQAADICLLDVEHFLGVADTGLFSERPVPLKGCVKQILRGGASVFER